MKKILGKEFDDTLTQRIKDEYNRRFGGTLKDYFVTSIYSRANGALTRAYKSNKVFGNDKQDFRVNMPQYSEEGIKQMK